MSQRDQTHTLDHGGRSQAQVRGFQVTVLEGAGAGTTWSSTGERCSIGSHPSNDLVLVDPTVSRFHCEIVTDAATARVRDLESRNGTVIDGLSVIEAHLRGGTVIKLGRSSLRFDFQLEAKRLQLSERTRFGSMVGQSVPMRAMFALLEKAAASESTVLLEGETGTGKERAAEAIHSASARRDRPFLVVDCSAIPGNLLESEFFGHEKGSFTGADARRIGVFEEASSGTVFLDEIGELPQDLQPKLLRVLEQKQVRRVGANGYVPVDVRVVAATNRDLRAEVNAGRFRSDLYYRLAVVRIALPPLRARSEDIPILVERILEQLAADREVAAKVVTPAFLAELTRFAWPGNVRELKNYVERCLVFEETAEPFGTEAPAGVATGLDDAGIDPNLTYAEGRKRGVAAWERRYLERLIEHHGGRVAEAAQAAGMDRAYLYRMLRRHGLKPS